NEPHMAGLRKELLTLARDFYQKFADQRRDDPRARTDLAWSSLRLADIEQSVGSLGPALEHVREARRLFAGLATDRPALLAQSRDGLGASLAQLGRLQLANGRVKDAEAAFTDAVQEFEKLTVDYPDAPSYRNRLAGGLLGLGNLYGNTGRIEQAEA